MQCSTGSNILWSSTITRGMGRTSSLHREQAPLHHLCLHTHGRPLCGPPLLCYLTGSRLADFCTVLNPVPLAAAEPHLPTTMSLHPPMAMARLCALLILLLTTTIPDSPAEEDGSDFHPSPRSRRAFLSRPSFSSPTSEKLYGWNCHSHPHMTKVYSFGRRRRFCRGKNEDGPKLSTKVQTFTIFQYKHTIPRKLLSCALKISRIEGRCGKD